MATRFDPDNPVLVKKLCGAVEFSKQRKKPFEEFRLELLRRITGRHYGENNPIENRPLNRLEFQAGVFLRGLYTHYPQAHVSTAHRDLLPYATDLKLALNKQINRICIKDSFNTCAFEALISMGVMEVGLTSKSTPPDGEGNLYDPGMLFADAVLFEDLILDMAAKHWDQQSYMGHDFVVPFEWVKTNPNFDKQIKDQLEAPDREFGSDDIRSEELSINTSNVEEFEDTIRLRQLFLPRQQLVLLFVVGKEYNRPLHVVEWEGPEKGPYHPLCFGKLPGNLVPLSPALSWFDLDDITNKCFNLAADQALAQKDLFFVSPSAAGDAEKARDAKNLDIIVTQDPKNTVLPVSIGGANQTNLGMALWSQDQLNILSSNPEALAGSGPQSETATQDQTIVQNASGKLKEMQRINLEFQGYVLQDLAFWMQSDPLTEFPLDKPVGNGGYTVPTVWSPENRMGGPADYDITVSPYTYPQRSPAEKSVLLTERLMNILIPLLPYMQPMGMSIDFEDVLKTLSEYDNLPEFGRWIVYGAGEQMASREAPSMPAQTKRTYERINRPGATQQGKSAVLQRMLLGGEQSQPAEMAALMRPTG